LDKGAPGTSEEEEVKLNKGDKEEEGGNVTLDNEKNCSQELPTRRPKVSYVSE